MKRLSFLAALLLTGGVMMACFTTGNSPPEPSAAARLAAKIEKVKDNLFVITGSDANDPEFSGGNTAVFITGSGVVLVDTKFPGWGQTILDRIRTVTDKPVTTIINTHSHADHTGSNEFFGERVEIVVQEKTKRNMARLDAYAGEKARLLPKRTFSDTFSLGDGDGRVDLYYFGAGHTDGDCFVVFPSAGAVHTGDSFAWKALPYIDAANGGSVTSHAQSLARAVATIKNVDTVITGHTPVLTWNDFREYAEFTQDFIDWARTAWKSGKTIDQATAEYSVPAKYKGYSASAGPVGGVKVNLQMLYDEWKK